MVFIQLLLIFCHLKIVHVMEFRLGGKIDIGPNMNYNVEIAQITDGELNLRMKTSDPISSTTYIEPSTRSTHKIPEDRNQAKLMSESVTSWRADDEFKTKINVSLNFDNPGDGEEEKKTKHKKSKNSKKTILNIDTNSLVMQRAVYASQKIRDVEALQRYFTHLYNRALRALDGLRERKKIKVERSQLHKIKHMYMDKIHEFITNMENQTLRTELGWQKAILNTLEVSNKVVNKLLDRMEPPLKISQSLRNEVLPTYAIQKEYETDEYYFICMEFNICRTHRTFSDFLAEILIVILKMNDFDVKQASDALTEVMGDVNYSKIMDWESVKNFPPAIKKLESLDMSDTRVMLTILKNMIVHRNMPIKIFGNENMELVNKTVAFQTILNEFDSALPGNKENTKKWDNVTRYVQRWSDGEKEIIQDIFKKLLKIVNKGVDDMSDQSIDIVRNNIRFLLT